MSRQSGISVKFLCQIDAVCGKGLQDAAAKATSAHSLSGQNCLKIGKTTEVFEATSAAQMARLVAALLRSGKRKSAPERVSAPAFVFILQMSSDGV